MCLNVTKNKWIQSVKLFKSYCSTNSKNTKPSHSTNSLVVAVYLLLFMFVIIGGKQVEMDTSVQSPHHWIWSSAWMLLYELMYVCIYVCLFVCWEALTLNVGLEHLVLQQKSCRYFGHVSINLRYCETCPIVKALLICLLIWTQVST